MITVMKVHAKTGASNIGKYEVSEAGKALAHIPNWGMLYDADFYQSQATEILNRVSGSHSQIASGYEVTATTPKMLEKTGGAGSGSVVAVGDYDIDPKNWTFFIVLKPNNNTEPSAFRFIRKTIADTGFSIYCAVSEDTQTLTIFRNSSGSLPLARVTLEQPLSDLTHASLVVFSFSEERGSTIRCNGEQVAAGTTPTGKTPASGGFKAGEWDMMRNANGEFGAWGGLNIDLTLEENEQYLTELEQYFMNKYNISALT
ncbi:hypothetical protein [Acinetobacter indicus]|uniref:LamG domain-containing protein n=1 Tax=Acinetobacter indicus TaxID=756892 RepID=A0A6C0Y3F3_9GAMM|nr:hypothetical protein [Acinetobacter indicus]QIC70751.1 hypothetical protein FSC09_10150 [Acinetobacter indicus]